MTWPKPGALPSGAVASPQARHHGLGAAAGGGLGLDGDRTRQVEQDADVTPGGTAEWPPRQACSMSSTVAAKWALSIMVAVGQGRMRDDWGWLGRLIKHRDYNHRNAEVCPSFGEIGEWCCIERRAEKAAADAYDSRDEEGEELEIFIPRAMITTVRRP